MIFSIAVAKLPDELSGELNVVKYGHGILDGLLRMGINITGGLIQDHDFRISNDGSGYGQQLSLAPGNVLVREKTSGSL
jgi:hypothetical protein